MVLMALLGRSLVCSPSLGTQAPVADNRVKACEVPELRECTYNDFREAKAGGALVFLHGLDSSEGSPQFRSQRARLVDAARQLGLLVVFPRGWQGALREQPNLEGWYPGYVREGDEALDAIRKWLHEFHGVPLNHVALAGFSNGAFLAARRLQSNPESFSGFYLLAGGDVTQKMPSSPGVARVVMEIGDADTFQRPKALALADHLRVAGYQSETIRVVRHAGGHEMLGVDLVDNLRFILHLVPR